MAHRIIYTSAPRLLQAGRSGFGVVARHKEIPQDIVEFSERISQFSRAAGFPVDRVVYAYRVFRAPSGNWHIMSRISDAGASFTGRTNHLAEHLVVDEGEVQKLIAAGGTPAGAMLAYSWPSFSGESRLLSSTEAWEAKALRVNPYGDKWAELCPDGNAKRRRLLSCGLGVTPPTFFEYPDRLRTPAGAKDVLQLFAESESDCPKRGWGCAFTTDLQPSDNQADFQWIGLPSSSPLVASLKASGRRLVDFRSPVPEPSATKRASVGGKGASTATTVAQRKPPHALSSRSRTKSSVPTWSKGLLLFIILVVLSSVVVGLFVLLPQILTKRVPAVVMADSVELSSEMKKFSRTSEQDYPQELSRQPRKFEKTFLVPFKEDRRPGQGGPADEEAISFLKNANASSRRIKYREWQNNAAQFQLLLSKSGETLKKPTDYDTRLLEQKEGPLERKEGPLELEFHHEGESQQRPFRIIEVVKDTEISDDELPLTEVELLMDAVQDSETIAISNSSSEGLAELGGIISGKHRELVLRADKKLYRELEEFVGSTFSPDFATFMAAGDDDSLLKLQLDKAQLQQLRDRIKQRAEAKTPPFSSPLDAVIGFLQGAEAPPNLRNFLNELLRRCAVNEPDSGGDFKASAKMLKESNSLVADKVAPILEKMANDPPLSEPTKAKQYLLDELNRMRNDARSSHDRKFSTTKSKAGDVLEEYFSGGQALLPAGNYTLGFLAAEGVPEEFFPVMAVKIRHISVSQPLESAQKSPDEHPVQNQ